MSENDTASPICSAKGCREHATWVLAWNNPKLHTSGRRKTWTACDEHREGLAAFLETRGFLRQTVAYADWVADTPA
jgi:hypothetical protein